LDKLDEIYGVGNKHTKKWTKLLGLEKSGKGFKNKKIGVGLTEKINK